MDTCEYREERPLKRTRQACDSCRRKKSKCSGERPVCTTCDRLHRTCSYTLDHQYVPCVDQDQRQASCFEVAEARPSIPLETERRWQSRIESLESTLAEVVQVMRHGTSPQAAPESSQRRQEPSSTNTASTQSKTVALPPSPLSLLTPVFREPTLPPKNTIMSLAEVYLVYCDAQPLPLFYRESFVSSLAKRDPELIFVVLALASRVSIKPQERRCDSKIDVKSFIDTAHQMVMARVVSRRIELSTLQTLILLAFNELTDGNLDLCRLHSSTAMTLARCARLHREVPANKTDEAVEERRLCYWSIVLIYRILGETLPADPDQANQPDTLFPISSHSPPKLSATPEGQLLAASQPLDEREGIISVVIRLTEVWCMAQTYIKGQKSRVCRLKPWAPRSDYTRAHTALMDLIQELSPAHRYRYIRLLEMESVEFEKSRDYWGPWCLSRFLYHTIICLLNHPVLIQLQLQGGKDLPEIFLEQTYSYLSKHTLWILHFIRFLESREFYVSDPIIGYCAAVVASIELYLSLQDEDQVSMEKKRQGYEQCLAFIMKMSHHWHCMKHIVRKLRDLAEDLSVSHETTLRQRSKCMRIDISPFFEILDLSKLFSLARPTGTGDSVFGPTLTFHDSPKSYNPTSLVCLPPITAIEHEIDFKPGVNAFGTIDGSALQTSEDYESSKMQSFNNDMLLSAHHFFNGYFLDSNDLDTILGPPGDSSTF